MKYLLKKMIVTALFVFAVFVVHPALGGSDNSVDSPAPEAGRKIAIYPQLGHTDAVNSVAFSPGGQLLFSGSTDNAIKVWDVASGRELRSLSSSAGQVNAITVSHDGTLLASGGDDAIVKLWDVATGRLVQRFIGHSKGVLCLAFSPDGKQLISGSRDNALKLWDLATGQELRNFFRAYKRRLCRCFYAGRRTHSVRQRRPYDQNLEFKNWTRDRDTQRA